LDVVVAAVRRERLLRILEDLAQVARAGVDAPLEDPRFGGDVGVGVRIGSALSAIPRTSKLDIGYKFGHGVSGSRWAVSFGAAFVFPWREIPVTCYRAQRPEVVDCPTRF